MRPSQPVGSVVCLRGTVIDRCVAFGVDVLVNIRLPGYKFESGVNLSRVILHRQSLSRIAGNGDHIREVLQRTGSVEIVCGIERESRHGVAVKIAEPEACDIAVVDEVVTPLRRLLTDDHVVLLRERVNLILTSLAEAHIQIDIPRRIHHRHAGAGGVAFPGSVLIIVAGHGYLVEGLDVMFVSLVAEEHILIHVVTCERLAAVVDDILEQGLRLGGILWEEIQ